MDLDISKFTAKGIETMSDAMIEISRLNLELLNACHVINGKLELSESIHDDYNKERMEEFILKYSL